MLDSFIHDPCGVDNGLGLVHTAEKGVRQPYMRRRSGCVASEDAGDHIRVQIVNVTKEVKNMSTKRTILLAVMVILAATMLVSAASAAKDTQLTYNQSLSLWNGQSVSTSKFGGPAGAFWMTATGGGNNGSFWTYCIDFQTVGQSEWYQKEQAMLPSATLNPNPWQSNTWKNLAWLNQNYFDDSVLSKDKSTGFQLALWNVLWDNDYSLDVGDGAFYAYSGSGNSVTEGQNYLDLLSAASANLPDYTANTVFWSDSQVQMSKNAVPEPMSVMLGIMGLCSVAGFRKLRRK